MTSSPSPFSNKILLLLLAGFLAVLIGTNLELFFANPFHEEGDIALNAIQIMRAADFREIYGNYSRFHFNHPGPVFFYLYAGAEAVLCHWLPTGLSPHNAHSLAGTAIQSAFLALALTLAATWIRRPLFLPLAVLAGAVHFSLVGSAFTSIWPPHVLLMPFLAFWVACLSVAGGRGEHLPWAVLAGCFLVHGHVAQPLFVGGLFSLAWIVLYRRQAATGAVRPWRTFPVAHGLAVLLIVLFLVPIVIDLSRGADSNFAEILRHMRYSGEEHKKPVKALIYFLSFFGYVQDQDRLLTSLSWDTLAMVRDHWPAFLSWVLPVGLIGRYLLRRNRPATDGLRPVLLGGLGFWAFTAGLCIVWGIMQTGPMLEFNGHFYHAITYLVWLGGAAVLATMLDRPGLSRWWGLSLVLLAALIGAKGLRAPVPTFAESGLASLQAAQAAVAADPAPAAPKLLSFQQDDWPFAASIGLALQRQHVRFYVEKSWQFMFQADHVVPDRLLRMPQPGISIWRFQHDPAPAGKSAAAGVRPRIVFTPATLSPRDGKIDFTTKGNLTAYLGTGISGQDEAFGWTSESDVLLQFQPLPASGDVELQIVAEPYVAEGRVETQPTELRFNGQLMFSSPFVGPGVLRVRVPVSYWNQFPIASIHLHLPNARSPSELGLSGDVRVFSLAIRQLTTRLADPLPKP